MTGAWTTTAAYIRAVGLEGMRLAGLIRLPKAAVVSVTALLLLPAVATADPAPYGLNDAGGFRNVLPPGEAGVDNVLQLAANKATGALPLHWADQQPLYDGLIGASASPTFGAADVERFFKDATFGVPAGGVESTETPRPGVAIVRDSAYGVPHVYGETRDDVMFGAGYANAEDRLFLMDVLRHTGRAQLSSFVGGSASNRAMDRDQWQFAPYTEADLQSQIDAAPTLYGQDGQEVVDDLHGYSDGINAYISKALLDPTKLPAEYAALGKLPEPWRPTDTVAEASLIGGIFGKGGGRELDSALTMQAFVDRFGRRAGRRAWLDFRSKNDPEAPTTVRARFPYETESAFAKRGLALPDRGSVTDAGVAPASAGGTASAAASDTTPSFADVGSQLRAALHGPSHASNWELVSAAESETGHPIGVLGPQVGYYQPQILMEEDLHGPGVDARGATFPGVGLYVLLGHGRDYAWSATTATSDNVDTYAEVLCGDGLHYLYKGECLPMEKLERNNSWSPNGVDQTLPGSETLTAYRTVHGIVFARGKVRGKDVAFVIARSTYFHEADSALFFRRMNDPDYMKDGPASFLRAVKAMNFLFNWAYIDSKHIAYEQSGWMPQRPPGTSPDFPILGTGRFDWKGYDPETHTGDWLAAKRHPQAVDPRFLVSWNNKQAPGWAAADDQYGFGPIYRSQMIGERVRHAIKGKAKMALPELVQAMEEPATEDIRAVRLLPIMLRALGKPPAGPLADAVETLRAWAAAGGHRRDLDGDGHYDQTAAVQIMDAWWPLLLDAEFRPALGDGTFDRLHDMIGFGAPGRGEPDAPSFSDGWYGYVSKDLRDLFGPKPRGAYSRIYCGGGSKARCRKALRSSLSSALGVSAAELYGYGDCKDDPEPICWDLNRSTVASAIEIPPAPFQNRPTFQQTVSIPHALP
ncbi:MAG: penicillin acylase family protein [Solirubrobacterales bacterium]|nr:penicillin acylase family protein [Solirubrobacterales bacterium]